jgi:hypothetical protein
MQMGEKWRDEKNSDPKSKRFRKDVFFHRGLKHRLDLIWLLSLSNVGYFFIKEKVTPAGSLRLKGT